MKECCFINRLPVLQMIVIIDNYDSFTYNIVQTIASNGREDGRIEDIRVYRNDKISIAEIEALKPDRLLISPGPKTPKEAGISTLAIQHFGGKIPILGVCLGHQSIGQAYGGRIVRADRLMHGKTSPVFHNGRELFAGLPDPFDATRYHSLLVEKASLPQCLEVTAWTEEGEIMGMRHREQPVWAVQFHPESILTVDGMDLLRNFLEMTS